MKLQFLLLILFFIPCVFAQGVGVTPSNLELSLLRDSENNAQFIIFNPTNHIIDYNIHNDNYPDWFEFEPNSGSIPASSKQEVDVKVSVNSLIANGIYDSLIIIDVGSHNQEPGMTLNIGTAIKTKIRVTGKQMINLVVGEVKVSCTGLNEPVLFEFDAINNGNVEIIPTTEITIKKGDYIIDKYELQLTTITPGKQEEYKISWDKGGLGKYKAQILVKVDDKVVKKSINEFSISAYEKNSTNNEVYQKEIEDNKLNPHLIGVLIMVSIVFIGFLTFLFLNIK